MREYLIGKFIKDLESKIPSDFEKSRESLMRCKNSLINGNGLLKAELQFIQRFKPLIPIKKNELEDFFPEIEYRMFREPTVEEIDYWKSYYKTSEYFKLFKIILEDKCDVL